jgi:hypothetical protein
MEDNHKYCGCVYVGGGVGALTKYFKDHRKLEYVSLTVISISLIFSPGSIFTTLNFLPNLQIGPIS